MIDRQQLLKDLQRELPKLEKDILAYSEQSAERTAHLKQEYAKAKEAGRTAEHFVSWREAQITQAAVAWVLTCVFVRFLEDNGLLAQPVLSGPVERESGPNSAISHPLKNAKDRIEAYFNEHPTQAEREYLLHLFEQLEQIPVISELLDHRHNPLWQIPVSADGAKSLIDFFQKIDPETGQIIHDFTDPDWDTRFLGDLYQDLSEAVRKRYALLQTPEFVESFILDYTLEPAIKTFGLEGLRLIDPTCGSGHFLLTTFERIFERWQKREPATNSRVLAQRALDVVHGVDINPYAIAICRFRLLMAAMKACEIELIKEAPAFQFNLACGDSLLHGRRFEWQGQGIQQGLLDDELKHVFETEDVGSLNKILGQQYHVVVGNPPYIIVRDKTLNKLYRDRYSSCHRKYSLSVPFMERFFELGLSIDVSNHPGYIGKITSNSFMKREFGKKLIEEYLVRKEVTNIIDTSGAFIPGHATPTVILFGRNKTPSSSHLNLVMSNKPEPSTPSNPAKGKVWLQITQAVDQKTDAEFISSKIADRSSFATHPWNVSGGGKDLVLEAILKVVSNELSELCSSIGPGGILGEDDIFTVPKDKIISTRCPSKVIDLIEGKYIRDWGCLISNAAIFPYDKNQDLTADKEILDYIWPFRTPLWARKTFSKNTYRQEGRTYFEYHQFPKEKNSTDGYLAYPEVASHNHFFYVKGRKLLDQTAPVIKLKDSSEHAYVMMQAYMNSSLACFQMKSNCQRKQSSGGESIRIDDTSKIPFQFSGTAVGRTLIPKKLFEPKNQCAMRLNKIATRIDSISEGISELEISVPILDSILSTGVNIQHQLESIRLKKELLKEELVFLQEELDWTTYYSFELCSDQALIKDQFIDSPIKVKPGERPFELNQQHSTDNHEVPKKIPANWPSEISGLWAARMELIESSPLINVLESPDYKRRWIGRQGKYNHDANRDEIYDACKAWVLSKIEETISSLEVKLYSCSLVADILSKNSCINLVAPILSEDGLVDICRLIEPIILEESVPQSAASRFKPDAVKKYRAWQHVWELQRVEDELDKELGVNTLELCVKGTNISPSYKKELGDLYDRKNRIIEEIVSPPKYTSSDYRKSTYWSLRGKFDIPKERFFSLPGCEKDGDNTLVIGWAGLNHLQRAQAIAAWYEDRKENDGWEAERLMPMLVAIDELIPWLKQWHNDIDPEYGERMGDFYESYLLEELRRWELTREELLDWRPPTNTRRRS